LDTGRGSRGVQCGHRRPDRSGTRVSRRLSAGRLRQLPSCASPVAWPSPICLRPIS
jgi:hypothetical protein